MGNYTSFFGTNNFYINNGDMRIKRGDDILSAIRDLIPEGKGHVSNSLLNEVKKLLINDMFQFPAGRFYQVGTEVHRAVLEPHIDPEDEFSEDEQEVIDGMVTSLLDDSLVQELLAKSTNEVVYIKQILGINMKAIIDILVADEGIGADLKTTSARTRNAFLKSIRKFNYLRQAAIYMEIGDLDTFYFIAVNKKPPFKVFIVDVMEFPEEMAEALKEAKILIDAIKASGRFK